MIIVGALLLPALLIATWITMWFGRRSKRWLYYFAAALGSVLLLVAVVVLSPRAACQSSTPMVCLDDVSLFGTANILTGLWTWVALLVLTCLIELGRHFAYIAGLRRTTDESSVDHQGDQTSGQ